MTDNLKDVLLNRYDATVLDAVAVKFIEHLEQQVARLTEENERLRNLTVKSADASKIVASTRDQDGREHKCPLNDPMCLMNCGNYGCGN